jgi:hypothetical protein
LLLLLLLLLLVSFKVLQQPAKLLPAGQPVRLGSRGWQAVAARPPHLWLQSSTPRLAGTGWQAGGALMQAGRPAAAWVSGRRNAVRLIQGGGPLSAVVCVKRGLAANVAR